MTLRGSKLVLLALLAVALAGCRGLPYMVGLKRVPVDQAAPQVSQLGPADARTSQLEAGRAIYVGQCARCHKPMPIQEFALDDWTGEIIPRMAPKAKLSHEETELLTAYIVTAKTL